MSSTTTEDHATPRSPAILMHQNVKRRVSISSPRSLLIEVRSDGEEVIWVSSDDDEEEEDESFDSSSDSDDSPPLTLPSSVTLTPVEPREDVFVDIQEEPLPCAQKLMESDLDTQEQTQEVAESVDELPATKRQRLIAMADSGSLEISPADSGFVESPADSGLADSQPAAQQDVDDQV